jgi:hypothetical protein
MSLATIQAKRNLPPAIGLIFLAPLVAEFLLGNLPITMLPALVMLVPLYGGGALLIRESVRRAGRGWPSILLLALAYGVLEEGFTTQSLFNHNYLSLNLHLLQPAFIPALGIGGWWTVFVLALHTIWSISMPIALVEATVPETATTPWLSRAGLGVVAFFFAAGAAGMTLMSIRQDHFVASTSQLTAAAAVVLCLVWAAFLPRPASGPFAAGFLPNPWLLGVLALVAGSAILLLPQQWGWWAVAAILIVELGAAWAVFAFSRHEGWSMRHKLALASGAVLAYAWHGFIEVPAIGGTGPAVRVGNAVFALSAVVLIAYTARKTAASTPPTGG